MTFKDPNKRKEYQKEYHERNRIKRLKRMKDYYETNKASIKVYDKIYYEEHKEALLAAKKEWRNNNLDKVYNYVKADLNALGKTKSYIRLKSRRYLLKYGKLIEGYQIHHCCSYTEPYKFIYCPTNVHRLIHSYLRQHNIDADSDHYEYIKHLLDDTVIKYNVE